MSTPFPDPSSAFPDDPEKTRRGCLFYGCIVAAVLLGLALLLVGFAGWTSYRAASQFVQQYAEDAPAAIPVVDRPASEVDAIRGRIDKFTEDLAAGKEIGPLELSADEINAIIASVPELRGIVAVDLSGDAIRGKVSLPFSLLGFPIGTLFRGKYLNGTATIDARVEDGRPVVTLVGIEAREKPVPEGFLATLRDQNLVQDLDPNSDAARAAGRLGAITVKDGKLVFTPKPAAAKEEAKAPGGGPEPAKPAGGDRPEAGGEPAPPK